MDMREFSRVNRQRSESPDGFGHRLEDWSLSDWFTAAAGEFGEAANVAKKLNRVRDRIAVVPLVRSCPQCGTSWRHDRVRVEVCSCGCDVSAVPPVADPRHVADLREQLKRELADTVIYLDLLAQREGIDLWAAVAETFNRKSDQIGCPIKFGPPA